MAGEPAYGRLLVPTDGSAAAEAATAHARSIATTHGATVHVLYVIDARITMAADEATRDALAEQLREDGEAAVDRVASALGDDVTTAIVRGTPWKEILTYAEGEGIDLIVIGSTGKSAREKRMRMGSVSERVVDAAAIPVLVVPAP